MPLDRAAFNTLIPIYEKGRNRFAGCQLRHAHRAMFSGRGAEAAGMTEPKLRTTGLTRRYGNRLTVFQDLYLDVADKEFVAIIGPGGCGKSTFLRI